MNAQLHQEVLMSYRLLFGQTGGARTVVKSELRHLKARGQYDDLLDLLCAHPCDGKLRSLPMQMWPVSCRSFEGTLQEEEAYSSQDDFPRFGQHFAKLQEFNLSQQPSKLRDLWRDRRNPLQCLNTFHSARWCPYLFSILLTANYTETEKPYAADWQPDEDPTAKQTNYIFSPQPMNVTAIKPHDNFDLDTHGFCTVKAELHMNIKDILQKPREVEPEYFEEIEAVLKAQFPEYTRFEGIEFVVRQRDERFPSEEMAIVAYEQPACIAHSDYSVDGTTLQLKSSFPGQEKYFEGREFDMLNIWRPLSGPNNDWPLALCDFTSIDCQNDIALADILHRDRIGENQLLYHNSKHRWYYIPGQQPEDLLIFRNADSTGRKPMAFHCAFFNPDSQGPPRQSCEVRFVAFR
ncbi:hypothetical protein DL98DRAFT_571444 [Cadophora sp. DSE1049]|nr:hypothetical protein DL98DRAFT_571444 [Cadophora sp. DSE1049]